uniref:Lymphoid enhancer-binding factor 1 n=1 Tax=Sphaerodactylus townsendi TaxID=933632 RepID=A0ACB8E867_9SAUR
MRKAVYKLTKPRPGAREEQKRAKKKTPGKGTKAEPCLQRAATMPQLSGAGGGGGDPELCATDEMIPFKDEGDPQKEKIFAEISHPEEEGDLADIKSSLVNESETIPSSNGHEVSRQGQAQESYHEKGRDHPEEGKHTDGGLYSKGPAYSSYSGYIMMPNMNNDPYMSNGSLSPPIPRTLTKSYWASQCFFLDALSI